MEDDDLGKLNARLNQLMGQNIAQGAMVQALLGMVATASPDWRGTVDNLRMMTEWTVKNLDWEGPELEAAMIRAEALDYLRTSLDDLHDGLLRAEQGAPPPGSASNPPSS